MAKRDVVGLAEQPHHLLRLVAPHQAVIDEDAVELLADRLVDQHRGHGAVDAARQPADHPLEADLLLDAVDRLVAERGHGPVPRQPQMSMTKFRSRRAPSGVWTTSRWNWVA